MEAEEVLRICGSRVLQNLSGSSVTHSLLTGSLIGSHLQADHVFPRLDLLVAEIPLVLLCFPAAEHGKHHINVVKQPSSLGVCWLRLFHRLTWRTSWGLRCMCLRPLWRPSCPGLRGSSAPLPGLYLHQDIQFGWCNWSFCLFVTFAAVTGSTPTFPQVHSLEHVSLSDAILLCSVEELRDLLHLLKGHGRALDLLHGFVSSEQAVDEFTQDLVRPDQN